MAIKGRITRISGPLIIAEGMKGIQMYEMVGVGEEGLIGEVSRIMGDKAYIQVYESTSGLRPGDPVEGTGAPLSVDLGPGLLTSIYDGVQRPLNKIAEFTKDIFIRRGIHVAPIPKDRKWTFTPVKLEKGDKVSGGDIIGTVQETSLIEHKVMVPPNVHGRIKWIAMEGDYTIEDMIGEVGVDGKNIPLKLSHRWPVRLPRPFKEKLEPSEPLVTGVRIIDTMFPMAKGGTGAIPGAFGTGKCVLPHTPILLADGELLPIEEVYEKFHNKGMMVESRENEEIIDVSRLGLTVVTFDGKQLKTAPISHLYKGRSRHIMRIHTSLGRTLEVTPIHKLLRLERNGAIREVHAANLKPGDQLVVPRKIPINGMPQEIDPYKLGLTDATVADRDALEDMRVILERLLEKLGGYKRLANELGVHPKTLELIVHGKNRPSLMLVLKACKLAGLEPPKPEYLGLPRSSLRMRLPKVLDEDFAEFLGLLLSGGDITGRGIRFYNSDPILRQRFSQLVERLFGIKGREERYNTVLTVVVNSRLLVTLLGRLGTPSRLRARNVMLPKPVLASPTPVIAAFLRGYYLGGGAFSENEVEFITASKRMASGLSYLLARLGVLYSFVVKNVRGEEYYRVIIMGRDELERFYDTIKPSEQLSLAKLEKIKSYLVAEDQGGKPRDVVYNGSQLLTRTAADYRSRLEKIIGELSDYTVQNDRIGVAKIALMTQVAGSESSGSLSIAFEDVAVDTVRKIEWLEGDFVVYDVTVPITHNFVGGDVPSILHNTVTLHSFAQWSAAKVVIYIGCGERGNEMTEVLERFPQYIDPWTGKPLMERTILIANTSNMPVAAREASIYVGITLAEYYRDMGYDTLIVADSTSRWAEALREIAGRLEEMPAEEGYPSYLASRLAEFYERAGRAVVTGSPERIGSVTVVGAVSPPGGDFTEPVTSHTKRFIRVFWALDARLAYSRHYPAINWIDSYSAYIDLVAKWWHENVNEEWKGYREEAMDILLREDELREIVRLVGPESLSEHDKLILETARLLKDGFLKQNAFDEIDAFSPPEKQFLLLKMIINFHREADRLVEKGITVSRIKEVAQDVVVEMSKARFTIPNDKPELVEDLEKKAVEKLKSLEVTG